MALCKLGATCSFKTIEDLEFLRAAAPIVVPYLSGENTLGPLDLITYILKQYVEMREHEYLAVALWIMHTHVFEQFMVSPRLAVVSPVRGCGKTIVLSILNVLCAKAGKTDGALRQRRFFVS